MWPLSAAASQVLRSSHQVAYRLTAYTLDQGELVLDVLTGGTVTCDGKSQVRRTARLDLAAPGLFPTDPYSALSPLGSEIGVEYGIVIPRHGIEWVPTIRGPIQSVTGKLVRATPGGLLVDGLGVAVADRSTTVAEDRLPAPTQTVAGALLVGEITRLITEALPGAVVLDQTGGSTQVAPRLEIDKERWADGIEALAAAGGWEVFCDAAGRFVVRDQPTLDDPVAWQVDAGEGGVLITADLELTRDQVYNGVVASGQRTDGTTPVSALVVDDDPASPTRWGGPFGQRLRYFSSPLLTTIAQCQTAGRAQLERVRGYATTVALTAITNPALEAGDVILVDLGDGRRQLHIVDQTPVAFSPGTAQQLTTRSIDLPDEQ